MAAFSFLFFFLDISPSSVYFFNALFETWQLKDQPWLASVVAVKKLGDFLLWGKQGWDFRTPWESSPGTSVRKEKSPPPKPLPSSFCLLFWVIIESSPLSILPPLFFCIWSPQVGRAWVGYWVPPFSKTFFSNKISTPSFFRSLPLFCRKVLFFLFTSPPFLSREGPSLVSFLFSLNIKPLCVKCLAWLL